MQRISFLAQHIMLNQRTNVFDDALRFTLPRLGGASGGARRVACSVAFVLHFVYILF